MKKFIIGIFPVVMGFAGGVAAEHIANKMTQTDYRNEFSNCAFWLNVAVNIIKSGQYCETILNQNPEMCLSVCVEEFERMGC